MTLIQTGKRIYHVECNNTLTYSNIKYTCLLHHTTAYSKPTSITISNIKSQLLIPLSILIYIHTLKIMNVWIFDKISGMFSTNLLPVFFFSCFLLCSRFYIYVLIYSVIYELDVQTPSRCCILLFETIYTYSLLPLSKNKLLLTI
jgi:hypothetical protein